MRIDRCHVVMDDHRIEVEGVCETSNDRQLKVTRRGYGHAGGSAGNGVGVGEAGRGVFVWDRRVRCRWTSSRCRWAGRDTEVQSVDQFVVRCIVDANLSRFTQCRGSRKDQDKMRVRVHRLRLVRWKTSNG